MKTGGGWWPVYVNKVGTPPKPQVRPLPLALSHLFFLTVVIVLTRGRIQSKRCPGERQILRS